MGDPPTPGKLAAQSNGGTEAASPSSPPANRQRGRGQGREWSLQSPGRRGGCQPCRSSCQKGGAPWALPDHSRAGGMCPHPSPAERSLEGPAHSRSFPAFRSSWLSRAHECTPVSSASVSTRSSPCVSKSLRPNFPLLIRAPIIGFRTHPDPVRPHLNFIPPAVTLFPNKVPFTGTRVDLNVSFGGHESTYYPTPR